jgi:ribosome biogenesis GTPase
MNEGTVNCLIPASLITDRSSLAVGDRVKVAPASDGLYMMIEVLPRATAVYRGDRRSPGQEILVATNAQHLLAVVTADYLLNQAGFLESALIAAHRAGISVGIFISKWDLVGPTTQVSLQNKLSTYRGLVDSLHVGSALAPDDGLVASLRGKRTVVIGDRGHGKTTLIRGVLNSLGEPCSPGKLPSTHASQMYLGPENTNFIDTPGVRDLALAEISEAERDLVFPEIATLAGTCHFRNCTHIHEDGCRVIEGLRTDIIRRERYDLYQEWSGTASKARQKDKRREKETAQPQVDYRHSACTQSFPCKKCGELVTPEGAGTEHRNHCPKCLCSLHVDNRPGDRASLCNGIMEPVSVWVRKGGEWAIIHRCRECGELSSNRIAADDNPVFLMSLAVRPLSMPPFPLNTLPSFSD